MITSRSDDKDAYFGNLSACYRSNLHRAAKHKRLRKSVLDAHVPSFFCIQHHSFNFILCEEYRLPFIPDLPVSLR